MDNPSGVIQNFKFGKFVIRGEVFRDYYDGSGRKVKRKDVRIVGDEVTVWQDRKGHVLKPEMITGVFGKGIEILILGIGAYGAISVDSNLIDFIKGEGIDKVEILKTDDACIKFNELFREGKKVGILMHGTC